MPDSPQDAPQINHFGEHWQEHIAEAPAEVFCAGIVPHEEEEEMEELPPDGDNMSSDGSEELDSDEGTPRHHCSDSISQAEDKGEGGEELTEEPAEELTEGPIEKLTKGPIEGPAKETTAECPASGQESPLRSVRETEEWSFMHWKKRLTYKIQFQKK